MRAEYALCAALGDKVVLSHLEKLYGRLPLGKVGVYIAEDDPLQRDSLDGEGGVVGGSSLDEPCRAVVVKVSGRQGAQTPLRVHVSYLTVGERVSEGYGRTSALGVYVRHPDVVHAAVRSGSNGVKGRLSEEQGGVGQNVLVAVVGLADVLNVDVVHLMAVVCSEGDNALVH